MLTMFVPRALRLKGVRELERPKTAKASPELQPDGTDTGSEDAFAEAMEKTRTTSPTPQPEHIDPKASNPGPRFTTKPITPEYIAQVASGIRLIFTDYAHQEKQRSKWLGDRYRTVDGMDKCT